MKLLIFLTIVAAFLANSWALKNKICDLPHSHNGDGKGSCLSYMPIWTFDSSKGECIKFIYGGCRGNANQFDTKDICEKQCLE